MYHNDWWSQQLETEKRIFVSWVILAAAPGYPKRWNVCSFYKSTRSAFITKILLGSFHGSNKTPYIL